jgi:hypothetical protein
MLPGAEILVVTSKGLSSVGTTDLVGTAEVPRESLLKEDAYALLVCAEYFFCGAFRFDDESFAESSDRFIALAPFTIH